ncbi:hypothetical protein KKC44_05060 [Patescibacteria group bacterium]|nr:hypothetical protein [Patescibacteria group bacterium]MBU2259944.1 hypothetical protein [Patescibacteria group bacterium]
MSYPYVAEAAPGDFGQLCELWRQRFARECSGDGPIRVYFVHRARVTEGEVRQLAHSIWDESGSPQQSSEAQEADWYRARRRLETECTGWMRIMIGDHFIAIRDIDAINEQTYEYLLAKAIKLMRGINGGRSVAKIRAIVLPWPDKMLDEVLKKLCWCMISVREGGDIHFFQHDRA